MALDKKLKTFKQFVEGKKKQDWADYTKQWRLDVSNIQQLIINKWFNNLEKEKLVSFNIIPVVRYEEYLGEYSITTLEIVFPNYKTIIMEPIAGIVIGDSDGKVDMYLQGSIKEKVVLLRKLKTNSKNPDWTIVKQYNGKEQLAFNKTNVEKIIEEWIQ